MPSSKPIVEDLKVFLKGQVINPSLDFDVVDFSDWDRFRPRWVRLEWRPDMVPQVEPGGECD